MTNVTSTPQVATTSPSTPPTSGDDGWARERARLQGAAATGDFANLLGLQGRVRALASALPATDQANTDPAAAAEATSRRAVVEQLQELASAAGTAPGSAARRALAMAVAAVERTGSLPGPELMRVRLGIAIDAGRIDPHRAQGMRTLIDRLDRIGATTGAAAQDPTLLQDPARLDQFRTRMARITEAVGAVSDALASGHGLDALVAAESQRLDGHVVRDVLAASRA